MGFAGADNLAPLRNVWETEKLALFSLADDMDACRSLVRAFIDAPDLGDNLPSSD